MQTPTEMYLLCASIVALVFVMISAQSVVQQCLSEQIRNNLNNGQGRQNVTPEATMITAFESICRNYEDYMDCFQDHLQPSDHPDDRFLQLIFSQPDMHRAYEGLCTQDLEALLSNIRCLLSTPRVRSCYNNFNNGINKVVYLERQKQLAPATVQDMACNVSVTRYRCETEVYTSCDPRIGQIMQDFFYAGIPDSCRKMTGVTSRYVTVVNEEEEVPVHSQSPILVASMVLLIFAVANLYISVVGL